MKTELDAVSLASRRGCEPLVFVSDALDCLGSFVRNILIGEPHELARRGAMDRGANTLFLIRLGVTNTRLEILAR